jgi:hypothetical protein
MTRPQERIPEPLGIVKRRKTKKRGTLRKGDCANTPSGVAIHLRGGELGVPQRDDLQGKQALPIRSHPLLDHPVIVGSDAKEREFLIWRVQESLAGESREVGKAEAGLYPGYVHILQALGRVVAAAPHVFECDGLSFQPVVGNPCGGE